MNNVTGREGREDRFLQLSLTKIRLKTGPRLEKFRGVPKNLVPEKNCKNKKKNASKRENIGKGTGDDSIHYKNRCW